MKDTGIGITADQQARLFGAYAQAEESTARRFGGTGLGLMICCQLVELMGGAMMVESVTGKGSSFTYMTSLLPAIQRNDGCSCCEAIPCIDGGPHHPALDSCRRR